MGLPDFGLDGNLPIGVHRASIQETMARFGQGSLQRRTVASRLAHIHSVAISTEEVKRFVVFGSFITDKPDPDDVDIVMIMNDSFDLAKVSGEAAIVFNHQEADAHFGASVFWTTQSGAFGGEDAMIEFWQVTREGGKRGIVEIVGEAR